MSSCSVCNKSLGKNKEEIVVKNGLQFHRACLLNLLSDKSTDSNPNNDKTYTSSVSADRRDILIKDPRYRSEPNEGKWECIQCSTRNAISDKRCKTCGQRKQTRTTAANESKHTATTEEQYDYVDSAKSKHQERHYDQRQRGRPEDDDDRYGTSAPVSKGDRQQKSSRKENVEQRHRNDTHGDEMPESDYDQSSSTSYPQRTNIVYIADLPPYLTDNLELEQLIRRRIGDFEIKLSNVKCYSKLGIGVIDTGDSHVRDRLLRIGKITLDPQNDKYFITFVDTIKFISYMVLDIPKDSKDIELPTIKEVTRRWMDLHKTREPLFCEQVNAQFPHIYRIVSKSLDELIAVSDNDVFAVKKLVAHIYYCADCSFLEDLPRAVTSIQIRDAIAADIGQPHISQAFLHVDVNRKADTACIIAAGSARVWSTKNDIFIDKHRVLKRNQLSCRLVLYPVPKKCDIQDILSLRQLRGAVVKHKHIGENLILELSDKDVFDDCLRVAALRINKELVVHVDLCENITNPEENEIDHDTWYETEMTKNNPDIMQYVVKPQHPIFHYKWNSQLWLEQFKVVASQKRDNGRNTSFDQANPTPDQTRHYLRVTVMLNTLATVRKRSYMIGDREVKLNLKKELKTIVYDHQSKLERPEKMPLKKAPYSQTTVHVVREDCLLAYERMVKSGRRPVLLNMASATSPGGGYRKGDGAQEENIFRRSDYCRSLDIDLDDFFQQRPERLYCSPNCQLQPMYDHKKMYPMAEYGAIYTSGITVFRQPEDTGYTYMENPLEDVSAIAMAAYRDPEVKGNMLAPKYAVGTRKKIENVFAIAYHHKHDSLVLSAFGCGAFKNPPGHIVKIFQSVIEQYAGFFKSVVFAIVDDHNTGRQFNPEGNFRPFADALEDGTIVQPSTLMNKPNTMIGPYRLLSDGSTVSDVCIFELTPCNYGAKCNEIYNPQHDRQFSHPPLCIQAVVNDRCKNMSDPVHMLSFIHRNPCRNGGECPQIDDPKHNQEFEHPDYCADEGKCHNQSEDHLKKYRHLPLCPKSHKCMEFQKFVKEHCSKFRHCAPNCTHGNYCAMFLDKQHLDELQHPFPTPCHRTPFGCSHYNEFLPSKNIQNLTQQAEQHCLTFAHVCKFGRNCTDNTSLHHSKSIHIARHLCSHDGKCNRLNDEEHLNSWTHSKIPDIRPLCPYASQCRDRRKLDHVVQYRHPTYDECGVVQYYGSNEGTDFVQNQKDNIENIKKYIKDQKWKALPSGSVPREILNWLHTVQPIHRCNLVIFESILLHGHVMSREYMEHLKEPKFVANSVLQHSRIRRIEALKLKTYHDDAKEYIIALICIKFEENGLAVAPPPTAAGGATYSVSEYYTHIVKKKENKLQNVMHKNDMKALQTKATEIAEASIKLHSDPAGIGHAPDKALGTDKLVFSILGPHLGHYYGDVIIIFKREILHHPDANFSLQAATSFPSGNAYKWRPWLGSDPGSGDQRVEHYHKTKLHAAVPGFDYAAALELITITNLRKKSKTMDVDLDDIFDQWIKVDSHHNIEGHLPQLIPLDYIDHIYIPKNLFDNLNENASKAINAVFKHRITVVSHDGEANQERGPFGPTPNQKSRSEYQNFVVKELRDRYKRKISDSSSVNIEGFVITIPSSKFEDHYVLPFTISQAYEQYRFESSRPSKDNITYIYWKSMYGDMMLTLSNEEIDPDEKQPSLRCLICYLASNSTSSDNHYYEQISYLSSGRPSQHEMILNTKTYRVKSNTFYMGCNADDFMTYCLEIHRSTGQVILYHAGPNGIYNHEQISCTFSRSELDLSKMEFIHLSAGGHTIPIRNLMICFEKQEDLHPTFDKNFKKDESPAAGKRPATAQSTDGRARGHDAHRNPSPPSNDESASKTPGFFARIKNLVIGDSSLKPCPNGVTCLIQYSNDKEEHIKKFSHPCCYSELCRDKDKEPHLTHDPHDVPYCSHDKKCNKLDDPIHRGSQRHTGLPDFLIPCRDQTKCKDTSTRHRNKYSHGEQGLATGATPTGDKNQQRSSRYDKEPAHHVHDERTRCKWGAECHDKKPDHRMKFSHPSDEKSHDKTDEDKTPCQWGTACHNHESQHRARYFHPKK